MPVIPQKPSFNHEVIKDMTLKELKDQHPNADEAHIEAEWHKAQPEKESEKPVKVK